MKSRTKTRPVTKKDGANDPLRQVLSVGRNVLIRTVTNYFVGCIVSVDEKFVVLRDASWIGDTGRFSDALKTGSLNEVEPFVDDVLVSLGALVDATQWGHALPRAQK